MSETMTEERTPQERIRSAAAVRALDAGRIRVPLRCGWCESASTIRDDDEPVTQIKCVTCGKRTLKSTARAVRRLEMKAIIKAGVDPKTGKP